MELVVLSFCKCQLLYYILQIFITPVIECNKSELTVEEHKFVKGDYYSPLFDENMLWKRGAIPLLNRKIFRGTRVTIREHPYVASIRRNIMHYLVATMLTKNVFITVAHPLIDVPIDELGVVVGENYADRGATLLTVLLVIIHENFNRYTLGADLALLRVYEDTPYRCSVKGIQLIHPNKSLDGHRVFVTGWGRCDRTGRELCLPRSSKYTPGEKFDPMLRSVSFIAKIPNFYCEGYQRNGVSLPLGALCVGRAREEEATAPCLAVPGAPMVSGGHLVAIQSWGYGCGYEHDLPLVYTSLQYHQRWLLHNVPLLRLIYKENLTLLFEAKRAYILWKWLNMTRIIRPESNFPTERRMEILKVDKDLARVRGNIIDIRDFLYRGIHHRYKTKVYEKMRQIIFDKEYMLQLKVVETTSLVPFLNRNITVTPSSTIENLFIDDVHDTDSDKSYEDYVPFVFLNV